jgi:hypothetical protein
MAAKKGMTDQMVRAMPGLRPAFMEVEKVIDTAQKIITYTKPE